MTRAARTRIALVTSGSGVTEIERDGIRFRIRSGETSLMRCAYAWPPDRHEMLAWKRVLRGKDIFVDVGANGGVYSLWAAACGATVFAYEPEALVFRSLEVNCLINRADVSCRRAALGAEKGSVPFTVDRGAENRIAVAGDCSVESVDLLTLDSEFRGQRIRGLKIDVEGFERLVLEGAASLLKSQHVDVIQLEWNSLSEGTLGEGRDRCVEILDANGYLFFRPDEDGNLLACDDLGPSKRDIFALSPAGVRTTRGEQLVRHRAL